MSSKPWTGIGVQPIMLDPDPGPYQMNTYRTDPKTLIGSSVAGPDPEQDPEPYFLDLPDPDPLVRRTDLDPDSDPSIIKQK